MIRITVELISSISPNRSKILGIAEISNDLHTSLETDGKLGSYNIKLSKWYPKLNETWKSCRIENFSRRKLGSWDLLYLALKKMVGYRNDR